MKEKIIVLASGTKDGGGSGLRTLCRHFHSEHRHAEIVGVVSNHADGGVARYVRECGIAFRHIPNDRLTPETYDVIPYMFNAPAAWVLLSGWRRFVSVQRTDKLGYVLNKIGKNYGLDPARTINIHPALLSACGGRFGGPGMYGHHVHEAVKAALAAGEIDEYIENPNAATGGSEKGKHESRASEWKRIACSGFTMHFVSSAYNRGPTIKEVRVRIEDCTSAEEIGTRVNTMEHRWQPLLSEMVVRRQIRLEGGKVIAPRGFGLLLE